MSEILQRATAGTMESSDAYVEIEPNENGLEIRLESVVLQQFGQDIEQSVQAVLLRYGVKDAKVTLIDRGALDCVIRARMETAFPGFDHFWEGELDATLSVYIGSGVLGAGVQVLD